MTHMEKFLIGAFGYFLAATIFLMIVAAISKGPRDPDGPQ